MSVKGKTPAVVKLLLILVPIYVGRIQEVIPYLDRLDVAKIFMIIGLAAFGVTIAEYRKYNQHLFAIPQVKMIFALFVLALISAPFSVWPGGSFNFITNVFLKLLLFVYLLICCAYSEEHLVKILWSFVVSVLILAVAAIVAPSFKAGRVFASLTYDPNDLALTLVTAMPVMFYMSERYGGLKKLLLLGGMFITLFVIIKTGSRGGFLSLVAMSAAIFFDKGISFTLKRLPLILVLGVVILSMAPQAQINRLGTIFDKGYNRTSVRGREDIWKRGLTIILHNPILGCGINQFDTANGKLRGGTWQTAHDSYILIGAELGLPGIVLFLLLIRNSFLSLKEGEETMEQVWIVKGLRASFCGLCVGMTFLSWAYAAPTFFLFGLAIVIRKIHLNVSPVPEYSYSGRSVPVA